jgi:hypothetical protein
MPKYPHQSDQILLDWESQKNAEYMQLRQVLKTLPQTGLREFHFLSWIARVETERGGLVRDYDQLAEELYCHRATAVRMVQRLEGEQIIRVRQQFTQDGAARKNEYRNDWPIIRERITQKCQAEYGCLIRPPGSHGATEQSHGATEQSHGATSYKEYMLSLPSSSNKLATAECGEWAAAAAELLKLGYKHARVFDVLAARQSAGETPEDFLGRIAVGVRAIAAPVNAGRWKSRDGKPSDGVGALRYFLETAKWPCEGVLDPDAPPPPPSLDVERQAANDARRERLHADLRRLGVLT